MRLVYLDEAGISDVSQESDVVVAGVILDPDKHWKALELYLNELVEEFVPRPQLRGFAFHATELFSGGKFFERNTWSKEARWKILDRLMKIPQKFEMPVVFGRFEKASIPSLGFSMKNPAVEGQALAFLSCSYMVEHYMVPLLILARSPQLRSKTTMKHGDLYETFTCALVTRDM